DSFLLVGQIALAEFAQPIVWEFGLRVGRGLDPVEALPEHPVEAIEMTLVLDQRGARQEIELVDVEARDSLPHRLQEAEELAQRRRDLRGAQFEEKGNEHSDLMRDYVLGRTFKRSMNCPVS